LVRATGELVSSACRNNEEIWIQIEGIVETKDPGLGVGFAVFNERQDCLFWSFYTDRAELEWLRLEPGTNVLRCRLPSRLLNEGTYRIELIAGLYARSWLLEPGVNAPDVVLRIQGGLSDSPYFFEARPTLLAPILKWELASVTNGPC
jgi:lipopolysaccharide transport system ATP-binding protein